MPKVDPKQLEPCPGPERGKPCLRGEGMLADPAIAGFDRVFRCVACHNVHMELVYQESGDSAPNPGSVGHAPRALPLGVDAARRAAMLNGVARDRIRGGRFTSPSPVAYRPGDPVDLRSLLEGKREAPAESEEARRARILNKYSRRK